MVTEIQRNSSTAALMTSSRESRTSTLPSRNVFFRALDCIISVIKCIWNVFVCIISFLTCGLCCKDRSNRTTTPRNLERLAGSEGKRDGGMRRIPVNPPSSTTPRDLERLAGSEGKRDGGMRRIPVNPPSSTTPRDLERLAGSEDQRDRRQRNTQRAHTNSTTPRDLEWVVAADGGRWRQGGTTQENSPSSMNSRDLEWVVGPEGGRWQRAMNASSSGTGSSNASNSSPATNTTSTRMTPTSRLIQPQPRPMPISCIPRIPAYVIQESPTDIRRIWPNDLTLLGITEPQKEEIDFHVRDAFRAVANGGGLVCQKKRFQYSDGTHTVNVVFPITLCFIQVEGKDLVLLLSKTVFASGGERKIRWVYELTTGSVFLKKRVAGLFEERLLNHLKPLREKRNIQNVVFWRTAVGKGGEKRQMIESVRDGTLAILFGKAPLSDFSMKQSLIFDLLNDLYDLHATQMSGVTVSSPGIGSQEYTYFAFHADIKPANVLVFLQNGKWRAELCDFGGATAHPTAYIISVGFTPPEYIRFYEKKRPLGINTVILENTHETAEFNSQHGRGRDVWTMGLVILSLVVEREAEVVWENVIENRRKKAKIAPLPCLQSILTGRLWERYDEKGILNLRQETLDADLDLLQLEVISKHPNEHAKIMELFTMLKGMLRIDPNERVSIAQCLASNYSLR